MLDQGVCQDARWVFANWCWAVNTTADLAARQDHGSLATGSRDCPVSAEHLLFLDRACYCVLSASPLRTYCMFWSRLPCDN